MDELVEEIIKDKSVYFDKDHQLVVILNTYGEFEIYYKEENWIDVHFQPAPCSSCEEECGFSKWICLEQEGVGWSNLSISNWQLLLLATIYIIQEEWFDNTIIRQLRKIKKCPKKDLLKFKKCPKKDLLPYILLDFLSSDYDIRERAFKYYEWILQKTPQSIDLKVINLILSLSSHNNHMVRTTALLAFSRTINKMPTLINQVLPRVLPMFSDPNDDVREWAQRAYECIIYFAPCSIKREGISKITNAFSDQDRRVREAALKTCATAFENTPQLINQVVINEILAMFSDQHLHVRWEALETYAIAIKATPQFIDRSGIHEVLSRFADNDEFVRGAALCAYAAAVEVTPQFIDQWGLKRVTVLVSDSIWVRIAALKVLAAALRKTPQFIGRKKFRKVLTCLSDPDECVMIAALEAFKAAVETKPGFINQKGIDKVFTLITFYIPSIMRIKFYGVRYTALATYAAAIENTSQFINHPELMTLYHARESNVIIMFLILFGIKMGLPTHKVCLAVEYC